MNDNTTTTTKRGGLSPLAVVGIIIASQFVLLALVWLSAPGYLLPFANHPVGRIWILTAFVWQVLGSVVLILIRPNQLPVLAATAVWLIYAVIFVTPSLITPILGPALVTIMQALGPVVH